MSRTTDEVFVLVFGGVAVIVVTARLVGALFARLGQPAVVGEVVGGLLLGPSALGLLPGDPSALLFPPDIQSYLRIVASLGLVIYLFIVGLELDMQTIRSERRAAVSISLSSIAFPFAFGALAALAIYPAHDVASQQIDGVAVPVEVERLAFVLFCGLAISGSAFGILARILDERRLFRTRLGGVLLASTVVDDIAVWTLASVVLAIAAAGGLSGVPLTLGGLAIFVGVLFTVVRPALRRLLHTRPDREPGLSPDVFAVILVGLLGSALYTTWLGISPILGAFFFGAAVPREGTGRLFAQMNERLESISVLVLLPVFFAVTGLGVDLSSIGLDGLGLLVLFVVLATAGKLAGAVVGASFNGIRGRRAVAVGVLMNTRGLTELALLSLGWSLGVLDTTMFSVLVCTAIVTTLLSGPMLRLVYPDRLIDADIAAAERARVAASSNYRVLLYVDDPDQVGAAVVDATAALARSEAGAELVVCHFGRAGRRSELGTGFMADLTSVTSSLGQLRALTHRFAAAGVQVVPTSQQTSDPADELAREVEHLRPHLVVIPAGAHAAADVVTRLRDDANVDIVVVRTTDNAPDHDAGNAPGDAPGTIRVRAEREPHLTLAVEVAVRLAAATGQALLLDGGRRLNALAATCRELGVATLDSTDRAGRPTTDVVASDLADVELLAGAVLSGTELPGTQLAVHAHDAGAGPRGLDHLRSRLSRPR